ncbi:V-type ATPase [Boletus reticuloceps]|uniref:V-type proton ATPase proteolipid subunit n=1 Tax=Boletus reticuloceps TaxID=495285 RepID=A0A8I3A4P0_9AGAM|nr:V-type ATPase [Boletus reticuloceps]
MSTLFPTYTPFLQGAMGCTSAILLNYIGASYGTAESGVTISPLDSLQYNLVMRYVILVIIMVYSLVVSVLISTCVTTSMSPESTFVDLGADLSIALVGLAAGFATGIVGDVRVRDPAHRVRLFIGVLLILLFAELVRLHGMYQKLFHFYHADGMF